MVTGYGRNLMFSDAMVLKGTMAIISFQINKSQIIHNILRIFPLTFARVLLKVVGIFGMTFLIEKR